jgi:hypothetical protein
MSEKKLEADIIRAIVDLGGEVDKFSQPRNTMQTAGIPDLRAVWPGMAVWVEVKWKKNKPSPAQTHWLTRECHLGNPAIVAYSVSDLVWALVQLGILEEQGPGPNPHPLTVHYIDLWRFAGVDDGAWADELAEEVGL